MRKISLFNKKNDYFRERLIKFLLSVLCSKLFVINSLRLESFSSIVSVERTCRIAARILSSSETESKLELPQNALWKNWKIVKLARVDFDFDLKWLANLMRLTQPPPNWSSGIWTRTWWMSYCGWCGFIALLWAI